MLEKPEQSLENQLKMTRSKRAEVKRVPLTPEEKEFLGEIMDKAVAAEKAGDLAEALGFYTDYKNELDKIKDEKKGEEKKKTEIEKLRQDLVNWAHIFHAKASEWIDRDFDLTNAPEIVYNMDLDLSECRLDSLPENFTIKGSLSIKNTPVKELPKGLYVGGDFDITDTDIKDLPDDLIVEGTLEIGALATMSLKDKAHELNKAGQVNKINEIL